MGSGTIEELSIGGFDDEQGYYEGHNMQSMNAEVKTKKHTISVRLTNKPGLPKSFSARGYLEYLKGHGVPYVTAFSEENEETQLALVELADEGFINMATCNKEYK